VDLVKNGSTIEFIYAGKNIKGLRCGQICTIEPVGKDTEIAVGDTVLCKDVCNMIRIVLKIDKGRFLMGNSQGTINNWIGKNNIFGKCIRVADK
jgi:hypothetical protein